MREEPKIERLTVDFYEADAGWLRFKLTAGQQSFSDSFSHVFDPLPDLKYWLEAVSIGVQQTSFKYNNEGNFIKFDFERVSWNKKILTISEDYDEGKIFIKAHIDRQQIVKAFYLGLLTFASSDKYRPKAWEVEYLKERLCKILSIDEETLVELLANLGKNELGKILFNADPTYDITYSEAADKNEEMSMFLQDVIDRDKGIPNDFKKVETPLEWNIPDDYNFWTIAEKREFVIECINEKTNGYDGMKLGDFRSLIIENFLNNQ